MKNWILSTHPSASAAFIKASEDTADLVPTATALKIHSDDITFKDFFFFLLSSTWLVLVCFSAGFLPLLGVFSDLINLQEKSGDIRELYR